MISYPPLDGRLTLFAATPVVLSRGAWTLRVAAGGSTGAELLSSKSLGSGTPIDCV